MQINVLLFAAAKEAAHSDTVTIEVAERVTAGDVIEALSQQVPQLRSLLPSCRVAVDCCYVSTDAIVPPRGEVAIIPPVSGG